MFLQSESLTVPTETHDYPEWHKGRMHYALWYLEIQHPELLEYLAQLRQHFSNYLFQPITRQFHITLYICGFYENNQSTRNVFFDDDFSQQQFQQQFELLKNIEIQPFRLKTGKVRSFNSALFIEIDDVENSLSKIRHFLSKVSPEIAALNYCPHITLGLYSDVFNSEAIFQKMSEFPQKSFDLLVTHLTFGCYESKILQGQLTALHQYSLHSNDSHASQEFNSCCN